MEICSLDEFIRENKYPVINDPSFIEDITKLEGKNYYLAIPERAEGSGAEPGFGIGYILNEASKRSGYVLISSGWQNPYGPEKYFEYLIKKDDLFWGALPKLDREIAKLVARRNG